MRILKIISESRIILCKSFEKYFGNFRELYRNILKIISKNFELNFEKFCKVFREFAVHSAGSCKVPSLQAKGCFSRSHTWFVYIQFLITISSPFTPWSKLYLHSCHTHPSLLSSRVILQHDNATSQWSKITTTKIVVFG